MTGTNGQGDPSDGQILGGTTDPAGEPVVLLRRVWNGKVLRNHPEIGPLAEAVLRTVSAPDHVESDPVRPDRKRYYARDVGPSRWLLVVVSYEQAPARIISAFAYRKDPPTWSP